MGFDDLGVCKTNIPKNAKAFRYKVKTDKRFWLGHVLTTLVGGIATGIAQSGWFFFLTLAGTVFLIGRNIKKNNGFYRRERERKEKTLTKFLERNNLSPISGRKEENGR